MSKKSKKQKKRRQSRLVLGLLIGCGAVFILFWNEGRAVKTAQSLIQGSEDVISADYKHVDPSHNGKLVHLTGQLDTSSEAVQDPDLELRFTKIVMLRRAVEMYQWKGIRHGKGKESEYEYKKRWKNSPIDSAQFAHDHQNPNFPIVNKTVIPDRVNIGEFQIAGSLARKIKADEKILPDSDNLNQISSAFRPKTVLHEDGLYIAYNGTPDPATPQIGDMKIRFYALRPTIVSVIALQQGHVLVPYQTEAGETIAIVKPGRYTSDQLFTQAIQKNKYLTWVFRLIGFILTVLALRIISRQSGNWYPTVSGGALCIAVISTAWLIHRPIIAGIIILGLITLLLAATKYLGGRKKQSIQKELNAKVLKLAKQKKGKLTVVEVMIALDIDTPAAKDVLDKLAAQGLAALEMTDSGILVYVFYDIQHLKDKNSSESIFDI